MGEKQNQRKTLLKEDFKALKLIKGHQDYTDNFADFREIISPPDIQMVKKGKSRNEHDSV